MCMRLAGIGSQYLMTVKDAGGNPLDGGQTYQVTLPSDIPAARFWSITLYDNQTRSMLETPQRFPRAGSQSYPTPAATANDDGSTTITFGPEPPRTARRATGSRRPRARAGSPSSLYSPLAPFFDKTWRPGEIEASS